MLAKKIGQYRVIDRLGSGGMGHVYRAADEMLGREVALKIIDTPTENAAARLRAEATALARINHPGIATVYELLEDDGRLVMAMELVRGRTLQQLLETVGVFSPRHAAELCMQALDVLEHAHTAGVIHRDLKPGNLMFTDGGAIKILDFGIARLENSIGLTNAGSMIGTPAYMAPEQVLGHPVDARTDVYAMGVVFFRLITGAFPFKGQTPFEMTQSQVNDEPAKATELRPELPAWVDDILSRALAKDAAQRFQSSIEFHAAIAMAITDEVPDLAVAPAVEVTEVMKRPEPPQPPKAGKTQKAGSNVFWRAAAAILVIGLGIWLLPSSASAPEGAPIQASAPIDSAAPTSAQMAADASVPVVATATSTLPVRPTPKPKPSSSPAPVKPGDNATVTPARASASFKDVKVLTVDGPRASINDAVMLLSDTDVTVRSSAGAAPLNLLAYRGISKATYTQGRDPKWDAKLSSPTGKVDVPGLAVLSRPRHWLVLQGPDRYLILRLDGADRAELMQVFEERAGISIDRDIKK